MKESERISKELMGIQGVIFSHFRKNPKEFPKNSERIEEIHTRSRKNPKELRKNPESLNSETPKDFPKNRERIPKNANAFKSLRDFGCAPGPRDPGL